MTIFWCGTEDIDFNTTFIVSGVNSTTDYDPLFSRSGMEVGMSRTMLVSKKFTETPINNYLWIGFKIYNFMSYYSNITFMHLGNLEGLGRIYLTSGPNSTDRNKIQLWLDNTQIGITINNILNANCKIDIEILNYSSVYEGTIKVYVNAVEVISYTGILGNATHTGLSYLTFSNYSSNQVGDISQIIVADEDTRLLSVKTLAPNAAGDTNQWSGAYTDIDEVTLNITDAIRTQEADKLFTTNLTGLPTGKWAVRAVKVVAASSAAKAGLGLQIGIKTNNEVHLGDSAVLRFEYGNPIEKMFQVNPATLENFTMAEIEALQIAIKSVAV